MQMCRELNYAKRRVCDLGSIEVMEIWYSRSSYLRNLMRMTQIWGSAFRKVVEDGGCRDWSRGGAG